MRVPKMDIALDKSGNLESLIQKIKNQDREDKRYVVKKKLLPLILGLLIFTPVIIMTPINNVVLFTGCFLVFAGLLTAIIFYLITYKNITQESYNLSLFDFLKHKEARLRSWKAQPLSHHILFAIYIVGVMLIVLGTSTFVKELQTTQNIIIFVGIYLAALIVSWISGEYFYRKRHKNKHFPLLQMIEELKQEFADEKQI